MEGTLKMVRGWGLLLTLAVLMMAVGCERVAPVRTLPNWVHGVYVPMIKNKSFEPGLEEIATIKTQEAFLRDGQLRVVNEQNADLTVIATIKEFLAETSSTDGDDVAERTRNYVRASVALYEPFERDEPLAVLDDVIVVMEANTDPRSSFYSAEPDRVDTIMERLGTLIAIRTISGFPSDLRDLPPGVKAPRLPKVDAVFTDTQDYQSHVDEDGL